MPVDNYAEAIALTEKIKANLPITAHPGKQYLKLMKKQGIRMADHQELIIDSAVYAGDEGGICCGMMPQEGDKQVQLVSITHLEIDPNHPLASEIQAYQRKRTRTLMVQNRRGFMAEMQRLSESKGSQKKKGDRRFGK
ncbi:MAG: hypothetical protein WCA35_27820 [Kovacikia sp.]